MQKELPELRLLPWIFLLTFSSCGVLEGRWKFCFFTWCFNSKTLLSTVRIWNLICNCFSPFGSLGFLSLPWLRNSHLYVCSLATSVSSLSWWWLIIISTFAIVFCLWWKLKFKVGFLGKEVEGNFRKLLTLRILHWFFFCQKYFCAKFSLSSTLCKYWIRFFIKSICNQLAVTYWGPTECKALHWVL